MANAFTSALVGFLPMLKWLFLLIILLIVLGIGFFYFFIYKRRRRWRVEVHEMKADGKLHTVGKDMLVERRKRMGTVVFYWMKKAKQEAIPPPSEVVDRFGGKEEVDYLRIERDFVPASKRVIHNYLDPKNKKKLVQVYDAILNKIHGIKATFANSDAISDRFIHIPIHRTLTAKVEYKPIPFDMNMMAVNEISNADAHFSSQYEWWKKYGAVVVFAATVIFLLIITVLTYQHLEKTSAMWTGKLDATNSILQGLAETITGQGKPPS